MSFIEIQQLLYPLGWIASIFFTSRMLWQWLRSEKEGTSVVFAAFWWLSLLGNLSLAVHTALQLQFIVCLTQSWQTILTWRNLELSGSKVLLGSWQRTTAALFFTTPLIAIYFLLVGFLRNDWVWMHAPQLFWKNTPIPLIYHLIGSFGVLLFSLRFWVQWIMSEKLQKTTLPSLFWLISLVGGLLSSLYFFLLGDPINMIGPLLGSFTYLRNLMLTKNPRRAT